MLLRQQDPVLVVVQVPPVQAVVGVLARAEGFHQHDKIDLTGTQAPQGPSRLIHRWPDVHAGQDVADRGDRLGEQRLTGRREGHDPDPAGPTVTQVSQGVLGLGYLMEHTAGVLGKDQPGRRRPDPPPILLEEHRSGLRLELRQLLADCGHGVPEERGGLGQRTLFNHGPMHVQETTAQHGATLQIH